MSYSNPAELRERVRGHPAVSVALTRADFPLRGPEGYDDVQAALGSGVGGDRRVVRFGDCPDDGEAESVSVGVAGALVAGLLEGPKEPIELAGRNRWSRCC